MYEINCGYTGYFGLPWPFTFEDKSQAQMCCEVLNQLRKTLPDWEKLKEFKIWDQHTGLWAIEGPEL